MKAICHQYPMRGGSYLAQLVVPTDLSPDEANRLCEFVRSLVVPEGQRKRVPADAAVVLWRVVVDVTSATHGNKPRTRERCLLVSAADEYLAAAFAVGVVTSDPTLGRIVAVRWRETHPVVLPLDLSVDDSHAARAYGRGMAKARKLYAGDDKSFELMRRIEEREP